MAPPCNIWVDGIGRIVCGHNSIFSLNKPPDLVTAVDGYFGNWALSSTKVFKNTHDFNKPLFYFFGIVHARRTIARLGVNP